MRACVCVCVCKSSSRLLIALLEYIIICSIRMCQWLKSYTVTGLYINYPTRCRQLGLILNSESLHETSKL